MFTAFWDKIVAGLADRWADQALALAFAFWGGAVLAWVSRYGWLPLLTWLNELKEPALYIALAVGGLLLLTVSSTLVQRLQQSVIRLGEGYWPRPLHRLRFAISRQVQKTYGRKEARWRILAAKPENGRTAAEQDEFARLDADLATYPLHPQLLMPTRLGNVLRAAEEYSQVRYGLAAGVCWPRLWLLLPKETQETIGASRQDLNHSAQLLIWGVLFGIWSIWAWWALLIALVVSVIAYWNMISAALVYGELLRATFDLHRATLYKQLRLPLPPAPEAEDRYGHSLTLYLHRGDSAGIATFLSVEEGKK